MQKKTRYLIVLGDFNVKIGKGTAGTYTSGKEMIEDIIYTSSAKKKI